MSRTKKNKPGRERRELKKRQLEADNNDDERPSKKVAHELESFHPSKNEDKSTHTEKDESEKSIQQADRDHNSSGEQVDQDNKSISERNKQVKKKDINNAPSMEEHIDDKFSAMDPSLLADHFAKVIRKHIGEQDTSIELEEKDLPTKAFCDHTKFTKAHLTTNLLEYLKTFTDPALLQTTPVTASPHTIITAESGIRVADLFRALSTVSTKDHKVGKFFSSHMKIKDNITFLEREKVGVAIGTPSRILQLVEGGHMKIDQLRGVVVDASYLDEKKRTILDQKDTFLPLLNILNQQSIKTRYDKLIDVNRNFVLTQICAFKSI